MSCRKSDFLLIWCYTIVFIKMFFDVNIVLLSKFGFKSLDIVVLGCEVITSFLLIAAS